MIVAGFGFKTGTGAESLLNAFEAATRGVKVDALATAADKACAEGFVDTARALELAIVAIPSGALEQQVTRTQSAASQAARKTGSVAEAAALAAAGPGATLLRTRCISDDGKATCALAEGSRT